MLAGVSIFGQLPAGTAPLGSVAALQGTNPWIITGSVQGVISGNSSVQVLNFPTTQNISGSVASYPLGTIITSLVSTIPSSVIVGASIFGHAPVFIIGGSVATATTNSSVMLLSGVNVIGSVTALQGTSPWIGVIQANSIVGTYAEDSGHTTADKGVFTLGVRNDAVASFVGANLRYTPLGLDSAGRVLIRPFASEESRIEGYASVVSTSVTTLVAAAGAGLRNYITDITIANTGDDTTLVTFQDGAASVLGYTIAPAGGGSNMIGFSVPMRTGVNATFDFQPTTATSILYATVKGFKAP